MRFLPAGPLRGGTLAADQPVPTVGNLTRLLGAAAILSGQARTSFLADLSLTEHSLTALRALSSTGDPVAAIAASTALTDGETVAALEALAAAGYAEHPACGLWAKSNAGQEVLEGLKQQKQVCEGEPATDDLRESLFTLIRAMDSVRPDSLTEQDSA